MLFLGLFSVLVAARSASNNKSEKNDSASANTGSPKYYVCLDGIKNTGSQPHALVRHNVPPGGSFFLMTNPDPANSTGWTPASQYRSDIAGNAHDFVELAFPDNYEKNQHYCVMYKNGDKAIYSRPYTYNSGSAQWAPTRSVDQDNAIAAGTSNGSTTYTSKNLNDKTGSKTGSSKSGSKKSSKKSKNSAAGIFCGACAGLVLATSILM